MKNMKEKEKRVYELLDKLNSGNNSDKSLAYECEAILSNESYSSMFEDNLDYVEKLIDNYYNEKNQSR